MKKWVSPGHPHQYSSNSEIRRYNSPAASQPPHLHLRRISHLSSQNLSTSWGCRAGEVRRGWGVGLGRLGGDEVADGNWGIGDDYY